MSIIIFYELYVFTYFCYESSEYIKRMNCSYGISKLKLIFFVALVR